MHAFNVYNTVYGLMHTIKTMRQALYEYSGKYVSLSFRSRSWTCCTSCTCHDSTACENWCDHHDIIWMRVKRYQSVQSLTAGRRSASPLFYLWYSCNKLHDFAWYCLIKKMLRRVANNYWFHLQVIFDVFGGQYLKWEGGCFKCIHHLFDKSYLFAKKGELEFA